MWRRIAAILAAVALLVAQPAQALAAGVVTRISVGGSPSVIVIDAARHLAYVSQYDWAGIAVIDTAMGRLVTEFPVAPNPAGLALDAATGRLWIANGHTVTVVDTASLATVMSLPVPSADLDVDAAARRVWVGGGEALVELDADSGAVLASVPAPLSSSWLGVRLNRSTGKLYVTDVGARALRVFDAATLAPIHVLELPNISGVGLAVDEARNRVYVGGNFTYDYTPVRPMHVIDGATDTLLADVTVPGVAGAVGLDEARGLVYVTSWWDYAAPGPVSVVDASTLAVLRTIAVGYEPFGVAVDTNGTAYVANQGSGDVSVVPADCCVPVVDSVAIQTASPRTNDVLYAQVSAHDDDQFVVDSSHPAALTFRYQWTKNGVDLTGATGATLDLSISGNGDRGDAIAVRVSASDGANESAPVTSAAVTVLDSAPVVGSISIAPAQPATDDVLAAGVTASDPDGDPLVYRYQWTKNGVDLTGATGSTLDLSVAGNGDRGDAIAVRVVANDRTLDSAPATAPTVVVRDSAPSVSVSLSTSTPWLRGTLVATAAGSDPDGDPLVFTYTWTVNGGVARITTTASATDSFDLAAPDTVENGDVVAVRVTASDGTLASPVASASAVVTPNGSR